MASHLSLEIKRIMRRELRDMGESILKKQCTDLGIQWDCLTVADLGRLTGPLNRAISAFTGKEKADRITREMERFKVLQELEAMGEVGEKVGLRRRMDALKRLGDICHMMGEWENALAYYAEAEGLALKAGDNAQAFDIGCSTGLSLLEMGRCDEARKKLESVLDSATAVKDPGSAARANRALGKVCWRTGDFELAVDYCQRAVAHHSSTGDREMLACLYKDLGDAYGEHGEHDRGLEFYEKCLGMLDPRHDAYMIANVHMNMGVIYSMKKDWGKAAEHYSTCVSTTEREGYMNTLAWALFNLAEAQTKLGMLDEAERSLKKSAGLLEKTDDTMGMAGVNMKMGELCQARGRWADAVPHFESCISTLRELGIPRYLADALHELGLTLERLGRKREAAERFSEAVGIYEKLGIEKSAANARKDLERLGP